MLSLEYLFLIMSSQIKLIIFDFDGTIADSVQLGYEIYQRCAEKYNLRKLKDFSEYSKLMHLSVPALIWHLRISPFKLQQIVKENMSIETEQLLQVPLFPGIQETIHELSKDFTLAVVTSNISHPVRTFLETHQLDQYFSLILGSDQVSSKSHNIRTCLNELGYTSEEGVLIGDSTRDIKDAKKNQLLSLAVCYGIHCREDLEKQQPDALVEHPSQILTALSELMERISLS
jgi:phosphoglycolate phosphatase